MATQLALSRAKTVHRLLSGDEHLDSSWFSSAGSPLRAVRCEPCNERQFRAAPSDRQRRKSRRRRRAVCAYALLRRSEHRLVGGRHDIAAGRGKDAKQRHTRRPRRQGRRQRFQAGDAARLHIHGLRDTAPRGTSSWSFTRGPLVDRRWLHSQWFAPLVIRTLAYRSQHRRDLAA